VLLLAGSLASQLSDDLFPKPGGLGEHVIQPFEDLSELVRADRGSVFGGHAFTTDYRS
jgi:hypothetical protein